MRSRRVKRGARTARYQHWFTAIVRRRTSDWLRMRDTCIGESPTRSPISLWVKS